MKLFSNGLQIYLWAALGAFLIGLTLIKTINWPAVLLISTVIILIILAIGAADDGER